jgi:predicted O-methyltransferase YrrM
MSARPTPLTEDLHRYLLSVSLREPAAIARLREETSRLPQGGMQTSPEQGQFLSLLVRMLGARHIVEIGVFTGHSTAWMALALPEGGRIIACDRSPEWTSIARRYWTELGVDHRIELRLGPARPSVQALLREGMSGRMDLIFVDADKAHYEFYYERGLELLRPGGMLAFDNTLWHARVIDPDDREPDTEAIRAFNRKLKDDGRVDISLVPIGDGLTLARKREDGEAPR